MPPKAVSVAHLDRFLTKDESLHPEICEHFCKEFGGEFLRVNGTDIPEAIAKIARQNLMTQVVLGQSYKSCLELLLRSSMVQQLMRHLKEVDLHIIATDIAVLICVRGNPLGETVKSQYLSGAA